MAEKEKIQVFIADDFDVMRQVIQEMIEDTDDIEVVGEAPDLEEALEEAKRLQPDVILMNDYLPPTNSAIASQMFRELDVTSAILIISMGADEPELIEQSFSAGANGFMQKSEMGKLLIEAIHKVHNNEIYLSPQAQDALDRM